MIKTAFLLISATAIASTLACGRRDVEVISTTTTPSTVTASSSTAPTSVVVRGTIDSINATARTVVVRGTTVSVPTTTAIHARTGSLTLADLTVGQTVEIVATQSGSTLTASEIVVEDDGNQLVQLQGVVSGVSGACPSLTFTVLNTTVTTVSSTAVDAGCEQIVNGATVALTGTRQSNGSVVASHVEVRQVEVAGSITALQGSCPVVRFSIGSTAVSTTAATAFAGRTCGQLANGVSVTVDGYLQGGGAIKAARVSSRSSSSQ